MLRKFPTLKNPSDLKTSFSLELCLFIKTSWSFGAPKIPQSPFCQKVRKIEMIPNLSCHPCHFPVKFQEERKIEKDTKFLGEFVFPVKRAFGIAHMLHQSASLHSSLSRMLYPSAFQSWQQKMVSSRISSLNAGPRSRQIEKNKIQRTKGNLKSSGLRGVDQCK